MDDTDQMVEPLSVVVKMDRQGRIVIPAAIRRKVGARLFVLELTEGELRLKPIKHVKLTDLCDAIEVDARDFTDTHELKRAVALED